MIWRLSPVIFFKLYFWATTKVVSFYGNNKKVNFLFGFSILIFDSLTSLSYFYSRIFSFSSLSRVSYNSDSKPAITLRTWAALFSPTSLSLFIFSAYQFSFIGVWFFSQYPALPCLFIVFDAVLSFKNYGCLHLSLFVKLSILCLKLFELFTHNCDFLWLLGFLLIL